MTARGLALAVGMLMLVGGIAASVLLHGGGIGMMIVGALMILSLGIERRYGRPGAPTDVPLHHFEPTPERFLDHESGQVLEVWIDPLTGERRYEPAPDHTLPGSEPRS